WVPRQIYRQHLESKAPGIEIDNRVWKGRDEFPTGQQITSQVNGQGLQAHFWHTGSSHPKGFCHDSIIPSVWPGQYPRFIGKIGNINFATMRPSRLRSGGDDQLVLEENFHV